MKGIWAVSIMASVLILGTMGVQQVFAPEEPEKLNLGGNGYNSDENQFEIKILVHLPKGSDYASFTVETTMELFKPDGTPLRATLESSDSVPAPVKEGGNNSSVHKLVAKIPYTPDDSTLKRVRAIISADLFDPNGALVDTASHRGDITLKRGHI